MNALHINHQNPAKAESIERRYQQVGFRGTLKPRDGNLRLGRLKLDFEQALALGTDNVGLFVEDVASQERLIEHFADLKKCPDSRWIIVGSSKEVASNLQQLWDEEANGGSDWNATDDNVIITTPEALKSRGDQLIDDDIAAILVVDFACHIHKCRGFSNQGHHIDHDRPQFIVDFRNSLRVGEWSPPIVFFTNRKAVAVKTQSMLSPYCLDAFRYIDGRTVRFGELPNSINSPPLVATA